MLVLHGVYRSRASRPLWLLAELDLPFQHVPVIQGYRLPDPAAADSPLNTTSPAFLALSPAGQIPVMEDAGLVLTESLAICRHIARKAGGPLAPANVTEEALTDQWMLFAAVTLEPHTIAILYAAKDHGDAAGPVIDAACAALARPLARLEGHLAANDWLVGDRFTVADLMLAECLRYGQGHAPLMETIPATARWLARCQARPAFKAMWSARMAEPE